MTNNFHLKDKCEIVTQEDGNRFVGIDFNEKNIKISFPLGYQLPETDDLIRSDIFNLLTILYRFNEDKEYLIQNNIQFSSNNVNFPLNSFMEVINYYMKNGYYMEREFIFKTKDRGKINWSRTIKNQNPLFQENSEGNILYPIYLSFTVRESNLNMNNEITNIHMYCVYESFEKLGWLFTTYMPPKPNVSFNENRFLNVLYEKLNNTNNDMKKRLFKAMIEIIMYLGDLENPTQFSFGTERFEYVWEKLIDVTFGITEKADYFPRAEWKLLHNENKPTYPLRPDTIMIHDDEIYVLDAKYYKYGDTKDSSDLPNASSINKQITYAEYIKQNKKFKFNENSIFNAFLMPYNKEDNLFGHDEPFVNIGEAISCWKQNGYEYEHIQGILVDIRELMINYNKNSKNSISELAKVIKKNI